ncbi:MAG: 5-formyltetrahydrofolate cyclo-ligase [Chryseolinea sp.]
MTKAELRQAYLNKRVALSEKECSILSHGLYEKFIAHFDMDSIQVLHTYLPLTKNKEPDTWLFIDWIGMKFPDTKISLPRINYDTEELENVYFDDRFQLQVNKWGLEEPLKGIMTPSKDIDVVIVPLLAFDINGNRVGYGKGYYDKFLATCRADCKRVGLSFFEPVEEISDIDAYDIPLNYCITPKGFFTF